MSATAHALALVTPTTVLASVSAANTAAATSAGIDLRGYEGVVAFVINPGAITGSLTPKIQDCDTVGGTYADVTGAALAGMTANTSGVITLDTRRVRRFVKFVGTIVTGPSVVGVSMLGVKKTTG